MNWRTWAALALLLTLVAPAAAVAQHALELRVTPRAGILTPADWFYVEFPNFGIGNMEWTETAILKAPIVGLSAELAAENLGVWLRAEALRTVGGRTAVIHAFLIPASQAGPARVVRTRINVASSVTLGTVDIGLPTRLRLPGGIQPYVTAGVGAKRYAFDNSWFDERPERWVIPQDGVVPVLNVGLGGTVNIRGASLDLLVRDAISEYWGEQQHDVMILAGLSIRLR
jgi:hypothetical protein